MPIRVSIPVYTVGIDPPPAHKTLVVGWSSDDFPLARVMEYRRLRKRQGFFNMAMQEFPVRYVLLRDLTNGPGVDNIRRGWDERDKS
jgi:hypothetical protein